MHLGSGHAGPETRGLSASSSTGVHSVLATIVSDAGAAERHHGVASVALANIARYSGIVKTRPDAPVPPPEPNVYLGASYVGKKQSSDVTFLIEGKEFYAHKIALTAHSEVFKSMFQGDYKEKDAVSIPIPNIRWPVFKAMMECMYVGSVEVTTDIAQELLEVADQYMVDSLKKLCEDAIAEQLSADNVSAAFDLAEAFDASALASACALFCLEGDSDTTSKFANRRSYCRMMQKMTTRLNANMDALMAQVDDDETNTDGEESAGFATHMQS